MNRDPLFDAFENDDLDNVVPFKKNEEIRKNAHIANGGEATFSCPDCRGSGWWRPGYACYKCKGKGNVSKGVAAAAKAKVTRAENDRKFAETHAAEIEFLAKNAEWSDFYRSLYTQFTERGRLTENQIASVQRGMAKDAARRAEKAEQHKAARPTVDISAIEALFNTAVENKVKKPIFRTEVLTISKAPMTGRNPGALYITNTETSEYLGKIVDSKLDLRYAAPKDTHSQLMAIATDPSAEAIKYARKLSRCSCCGRTLVDPVSVVSVIGPICAEKWGLTALRDAAREELDNDAN